MRPISARPPGGPRQIRRMVSFGEEEIRQKLDLESHFFFQKIKKTLFLILNFLAPGRARNSRLTDGQASSHPDQLIEDEKFNSI
jgi:hypothetical protein